MNKRELIEEISTATDFNLTACEKMLNATLEAVMNAVARNDVVLLKGFGSFSSVSSPKKTITHPATGEKMVVPAKRRVKFSSGKLFKELLN